MNDCAFLHNISMTHLLICGSPCRLVGASWVSVNTDFCASAGTKIALLSMFIPGLQCDRNIYSDALQLFSLEYHNKSFLNT